MIQELNLHFSDVVPYVDLNIMKLPNDIRSSWKEFCMYVGSLCEKERELEVLDE